VGVEYVEIQPDTGLRAGFGCPGDPELFIVGTAPRESCRAQFVERPQEPRESAAVSTGTARKERPPRRTRQRRSAVGRMVRGVVDLFDGIFGRR